MNFTQKDRARFESKLIPEPTTGCWLWTAAGKTYGRFTIAGTRRLALAHRVSYEMFVGPIPEGDGYHGTCVLHRCDTPACVNPGHLFIGTITDNNQDTIRKGRGAVGPKNGTHKHPERRPRGERHGTRTKPERLPRGERHGMHKLTEDKVRQIRASASDGTGRHTLARRFAVTPECITQVVSRQTWRHVQ